MKSLAFAALAALCLGSAVACRDPLRVEANSNTVTVGLAAYAITGTPASFPSAVLTTVPAVVRLDGNLNFDLAFDLEAGGKVKLLPVQFVGDAASQGRRVGMVRSSIAFPQLTEAPKGGYQYDSTFTVSPGESVVLVAPHANPGDMCYLQFASEIYSKIVVDSVDAASRLIYFKITTDPNCGFRSFAQGIPKF